MDGVKPLVSVFCTAYNHEQFIDQCLSGFVMQITDFSFEILINDDLSIDGTANIIKKYEAKYPDIICAIYQKENQYSKGIDIMYEHLLPRAKGKYIALCEGDDYWTDPLKLQKQVDFLENNPDFGMIHTNYNVVDENDTCRNKLNRTYPSGNVISHILKDSYNIVTATVLFRKELYLNSNLKYDSTDLMGDLPIWLEIAHLSKIKFLNEKTTNYRELLSSASHSENLDVRYKFCANSVSIRDRFSKEKGYHFSLNKAYANVYADMVKQCYIKKRKDLVLNYYCKIAHLDFVKLFNPRVVVFLLATKNTFFAWVVKLIYKIK